MNLCDVCLRRYSDCMHEHENEPKIIYGNDGEHNDAVLECDWFVQKPKETSQ